MSVKETVRCTGHNRNGQRCKRRTARTTECFQHLQQDMGLRVKQSTIPHGGLGLFTTIPRHYSRRSHRGDFIAPYDGRQVITDDPNFGIDNNYVLTTSLNHHIDGSSTSGIGRWANDIGHGGHGRNNAKLKPVRGTNTATIRASKNIAAGSEIGASYGRGYWAVHDG